MPAGSDPDLRSGPPGGLAAGAVGEAGRWPAWLPYLETVLSDPSASLVAVPGRAGVVVALASLVPGCGSSAELGVLVEDAWQRRGIGRQLVAHLIVAASARQVTELTASVLTQNATVADLLRQVPGEFSVTHHGTTVSVRVRLHPRGRPCPGPLTGSGPLTGADMENAPDHER